MAATALPALPRAVAAATGSPAPSYRTLYALALDGRIPAHQRTGRWYVDDADLPAVIRALGLSLLATNKKRKAAPPPATTKSSVRRLRAEAMAQS